MAGGYCTRHLADVFPHLGTARVGGYCWGHLADISPRQVTARVGGRGLPGTPGWHLLLPVHCQGCGVIAGATWLTSLHLGTVRTRGVGGCFWGHLDEEVSPTSALLRTQHVRHIDDLSFDDAWCDALLDSRRPRFKDSERCGSLLQRRTNSSSTLPTDGHSAHYGLLCLACLGRLSCICAAGGTDEEGQKR